MTTSQKILSIVSAVVALVLVFVKLYWPALAVPFTQISVAVVACLAAILAVTYPVSAAVVALRHNYAMAQAPRKLPKVGNTNDDISNLMNAIYADLDGSGIPYKTVDGKGQVTIDPVPVAPRISQVLSNSWNSLNVSMAFKLKLLETALAICTASFITTTNLKAPESWDDVADYNKFWRLNQVKCAVHSEGLFRQVLMPLRTCLKIQDTHDV